MGITSILANFRVTMFYAGTVVAMFSLVDLRKAMTY